MPDCAEGGGSVVGLVWREAAEMFGAIFATDGYSGGAAVGWVTATFGCDCSLLLSGRLGVLVQQRKRCDRWNGVSGVNSTLVTPETCVVFAFSVSPRDEKGAVVS